jgi:hypothetical protein
MPKIEDTLAQRGSAYGDWREQGRVAQNLKRAMHDSPNWLKIPSYMREGLDMVQHKISRVLNGNPFYDDNFHDMIGYTKLMQDRSKQDVDSGVSFKGGGDPMYPTYTHEDHVDGPCQICDGMAGPLPSETEVASGDTSLKTTINRVRGILNHCLRTSKKEASFWVEDIETLVESPTRNAAVLISIQRSHVENIRRIVNLTGVSDADKIAQIKNAMGDV